MQRYTIKQIWRSMKEAEQGEFVRYEDVEQENETNKRMFRSLWNDWIIIQQEYNQACELVEHLEARVRVMFCIIMAMMGLAVGKLIGWSFGL
jgi:hypothetical protein